MQAAKRKRQGREQERRFALKSCESKEQGKASEDEQGPQILNPERDERADCGERLEARQPCGERRERQIPQSARRQHDEALVEGGQAQPRRPILPALPLPRMRRRRPFA